MREQISAEAITAALDQTNPNGPNEMSLRGVIQCVTINRRISLFGQIRPPCASCVIVYRDDFEVNYILFGEFVAILINRQIH